MKRWLWARRILCVGLLAPLVLGMGLSEDAFMCENAVSHLVECCPTFSTALAHCPGLTFTCGGGEPPPELTLTESICIQDMDCEAIKAANICARVEALQAVTDADAGADAGVIAPRGAVCP